MRQLKEIATEILKKKFGDDPKAMAVALGVDLMYVRRAVGLAASDGSTQQKAFEFTVKLLPYCKELNIDPARELKKPSDEEVLDAIKLGSPTDRRPTGSGKKGHAAPPAGAVPPRRTAGNRRRD